MSEASESLYGEPNAPQPVAPKPAAPGLLEQIGGIFTEPTKLFQRLHTTPTWGWALGALIVISIVMTIAWGLKVDEDVLLRPALERNPNMDPSQIELAKKFVIFVALPIQIPIFTTIAMLVMGFFYWLIGKGTAEAEAPSYRHALTVASVPSLVTLPYLLIITVMCFLRPVEGLTPEKLSPTSLGFYLHPESVKLHALLASVDVFLIASYVMVYLAARHTLKLKAGGAWACALLAVVLTVGVKDHTVGVKDHTVVAAPTATITGRAYASPDFSTTSSLITSPATVPAGSGCGVTFTFTGADTAKVDAVWIHGTTRRTTTSTVASDVETRFLVPSPGESVEFTLTVTNAAGAVASQEFVVIGTN